MRNAPSVSKYRADIDGLRALAVFSVVLFHAFPRLLSGGFVGVDVFFVISGFLITSILLVDMENEKFRFTAFYARRIRRIFPALIVVLIACLGVGWFYLLADEYRMLGKHVAAGTAFFSNIAYISESGYFDANADTKILLHLWSLGVEEQYYIFWPAIVWACWRRLGLEKVIALLLLGSFAYSIYAIGIYAPTAFYSPLSRVWELLTGGLLAYYQYGKPGWLAGYANTIPSFGHTALRAGASALGIGLLLHSVVHISPMNSFPGWVALEPTMGTFLVLIAGPQAWINRRILANPVVVWLGLISYPLYLWHWPLLVLTKNVEGEELSTSTRSCIILISIFLAWLTYRFVETPIRFSKSNVRSKLLVLCIAMICVGSFGEYLYKFADDNFRTADQERKEYSAYFEHLNDHSIVADEAAEVFHYECGFYDHDSAWRGSPTNVPRPSISSACYAKHSRRSVLLWGDSFAAHLYSGLNAALPKDVSLMLVWSAGCQVAPVDPALVEIQHCQKSNSFALSLIKDARPDVVVLSASNSYDIKYIRELIPLLSKYGVKHMFVVSQVPIWDRFLYKIVAKNYWNRTPEYIPGHLNERRLSASKEFESLIRPDDSFEYIDLRKLLCHSDGCLTYLGANRMDGLYTLDDAHLRPIASRYVADSLLVPLLMKQFERIEPSRLR